MKKLSKKNILIVIFVLILFIQVFTIDKTITPVDANKDFIAISQPNAELTSLIKIACYDCHSNQPNFPWYTNVAPVSWWVKNHMNEGKRHLNFSEWSSYSQKKKNHKLDECVEMIEEDEMPLASYTIMHKQAKLNNVQKLQLVEFFKAQKSSN